MTRPGGVAVALSLVGLWTLAVTQPLLDLLGRNAAFLVAHDATAGDTVLLVLSVAVLAPLLLAAFVVALRRLSAAAGLWLYVALAAALLAVFCLVVLQLAGLSSRWPAVISLTLAIVLGSGVAAALATWQRLRIVVACAAAVAPAVALLFVFASPARSLIIAPSSAGSAALTLPEDPPPIVMVVFDELPAATLLGRDGTVQAEAFPNFARLAADATLLRDVTTVHGQTSDSVPAILTGRYPRADALPLAADHPGNLFALLDGVYERRVEEPLTQLCAGRCGAPSRPFLQRQAELYVDLSVVAGHLVLPEELAAGLPPLDQGWRDFRTVAAEAGKEEAVKYRFREAREQSPVATFEDFVTGIDASPDPTLHYIHTLLPHGPWRYLPDGSTYAGTEPPAGLDRGRWTADDWPVAQGYQRHLLQTQLADRLLGSLLDRLEAEGMYDDALVVVLSDHGASFTPDTSLRVAAEQTMPEIARVPVILKAPGQSDGDVIDRPLETVDVLPTLLDALGARPPAGLAGRSAFDENAPDRTVRRFFGALGEMQVPVQVADITAVVDRKLSWFDAAASPDGFVYGLAPQGLHALLGQPASGARDAAGSWALGGAECPEPAGADSADSLPALLCATLRVDGAAQGAVQGVALAVDERIVAVTQVPTGALGTGVVRALLPQGARGRDAADLRVLLIGADGSLYEVPAT